VSRTALGPSQPPIQWEPGAPSLGVKRPGVNLATHFHLVPRSRMRGTMPPLPSTPSWRDARLKKSTGTTIHLQFSLGNMNIYFGVRLFDIFHEDPEKSPRKYVATRSAFLHKYSSSFLGSTAHLRPWPPPQNLAEFLGGFSTIFFFTG
jgi:hypothetical protein